MLKNRIISVSLAIAVALVGMFSLCTVTQIGIADNASAGTTATQNITEMIEGLVPSFTLLIFVMVFMMMLLAMVDRIGKK